MKWLLLIFLLICTIIVNNAHEKMKGTPGGQPYAQVQHQDCALPFTSKKRLIMNGPCSDLLHKCAFYLAYILIHSPSEQSPIFPALVTCP